MSGGCCCVQATACTKQTDPPGPLQPPSILTQLPDGLCKAGMQVGRPAQPLLAAGACSGSCACRSMSSRAAGVLMYALGHQRANQHRHVQDWEICRKGRIPRAPALPNHARHLITNINMCPLQASHRMFDADRHEAGWRAARLHFNSIRILSHLCEAAAGVQAGRTRQNWSPSTACRHATPQARQAAAPAAPAATGPPLPRAPALARPARSMLGRLPLLPQAARAGRAASAAREVRRARPMRADWAERRPGGGAAAVRAAERERTLRTPRAARSHRVRGAMAGRQEMLE